MDISERLRQLRKENQISQEELAKKLGITQKAVSKYETGARKPANNILIRIAQLFNASTDYLFGLTEKRPLYIEQDQIGGGNVYFGNNLQYLRKKNGLTQESLAKEIDIEQSTLANYERSIREPNLEKLISITGYFNVSIDDLLTKDLRPASSILSRNLKYLRTRENYSQGDMARLLKISESDMSKYESGIIELSNQGLLNVSGLFDVTVDDLLKRDLSKGGI